VKRPWHVGGRFVASPRQVRRGSVGLVCCRSAAGRWRVGGKSVAARWRVGRRSRWQVGGSSVASLGGGKLAASRGQVRGGPWRVGGRSGAGAWQVARSEAMCVRSPWHVGGRSAASPLPVRGSHRPTTDVRNAAWPPTASYRARTCRGPATDGPPPRTCHRRAADLPATRTARKSVATRWRVFGRSRSGQPAVVRRRKRYGTYVRIVPWTAVGMDWVGDPQTNNQQQLPSRSRCTLARTYARTDDSSPEYVCT
jgi:hypothetical protein